MVSDNKSRILRDAEKFVLQGKTQQAISEYLKIVKADPNDVLTLNTIGDLHLLLGRTTEANGYFSQVAENYARNNFLLKAIAVYKKILNGDPQNLLINQTLASLFARHGLNGDARNQYLKVAEISVREGKTRESLEAYEKVAELDPLNAEVQLRLAEFQLASGSKEKAHDYLTCAARAQVKAGNLLGAINSFRRALKLNPADGQLMRGLLDACIQMKDVSPVLEQLKESLAIAPNSIDLLEMQGRACLAAGDPKSAAKAFQHVVSEDESRYGLFFEIQKAFLAAGDLDAAAASLDDVTSVLIGRRECARAVEAYKALLEVNPSHIPSWTRLANIYSALNDQPQYLVAQDKLANLLLSQQNPHEALEHLERILQIDPASEKHLGLHREAFADAYPGMPYVAPARGDLPALELRRGTPLADLTFEDVGNKASTLGAPTMVEVDLLLNYGMKDKALDLLRVLEVQDPSDREIRQKLITLYREQNQPTLAAEQCLLLAGFHRKAGDEEAVKRLVAEAKRLDAELVAARSNELLPPLQQDTIAEPPVKDESIAAVPSARMEVDLSEDLSEIFFHGSGEAVAPAETEAAGAVPEEQVEEYASAVTARIPEGSLADQLQEVDFYIRLGFFEEARAKLDEISKDHPDDAELPPRYHKITEGLSQQKTAPIAEKPIDLEQVQAEPEDLGNLFGDLNLDELATPRGEAQIMDSARSIPDERGMLSAPVETTPPVLSHRAMPEFPGGPSGGAGGEVREGQVNNMFADLIDEVNSLTDQEIAREDFETHFSLGIAYREMNLLDEAIKEFQESLKALDPRRHPREAIQCCGMLSTCFLGKGMPRSAVRWCESGLAVTEISQHEAMALRYDMGVAFTITGEADRALECFETIFGMDPGYRDITQKIDELRGGPGRNVP